MFWSLKFITTFALDARIRLMVIITKSFYICPAGTLVNYNIYTSRVLWSWAREKKWERKREREKDRLINDVIDSCCCSGTVIRNDQKKLQTRKVTLTHELYSKDKSLLEINVKIFRYHLEISEFLINIGDHYKILIEITIIRVNNIQQRLTVSVLRNLIISTVFRWIVERETSGKIKRCYFIVAYGKFLFWK